MKKVKHWQPVVDKFNNKLSSWKSRTLSFVGQLSLIKAVLGSLPSYYLSLFQAPKSKTKKLEGIRRDFPWGKSGTRSKVGWVKWDKILKPRALGGLGVGGIAGYNLAMMVKWWWRYKNETPQLWTEVAKAIHTSRSNKHLIPIKKANPGIWKDIGNTVGNLLKLGIEVKNKLEVKVGDGSKCYFWTDKWAAGDCFSAKFPDLFKATGNKILVQDCFFRRDGTQPGTWELDSPFTARTDPEQLSDLSNILLQLQFNGVTDKWVWTNNSGFPFSVKEVRLEVAAAGETSIAPSHNFYWNSWAPLKANYLLWRAIDSRVATKVELARRGVSFSILIVRDAILGRKMQFIRSFYAFGAKRFGGMLLRG